MRLRRIVATLGLIALIAVPTALALGITPDIHELPDATTGLPYSFQLGANGGCAGSYTFTVSSGSLPPGIQLSSGGLLSGTPTEPGTWSFYVQLATGGSCSGQAPTQHSFTIQVVPKLTVTTNSIPFGVVGTGYSQQLTYSGGSTVTWSVSAGSLPPGLTLNPSTGLLSGTPTTVGTTTFTVYITDGTRSDTKVLTLDVVAPLTATVGSAPPAEAGIAFKGIVPTATGGKAPYAWKLASGALPAGLAFDPATGTISGTPTTAGSYSVQLSATDSYSTTATVTVPLVVSPKLAVKAKLLKGGKQGTPYQVTFATLGGVQPVTWKATSGHFPIGVRLNRTTGVLAGTPRSSGVFRFTLTATDKLGGTAQQSYTVVVKAKPKPKPKKKK